VRIEKLGERGVGIGHLGGAGREGKVVMVPFSAPGDLADLHILHETSSYARARIVRLREGSPERVAPPCPVFGACGGCSLQHLAYARQLEHKRALLGEVFRSFTPTVPVEPVAPSPLELRYRNKLQMQAGSRGGRLVAGFYRALSHEIVPVDSCLLQSEAANALARDTVEVLGRHGVKAYERASRRGELRDIVIREAAATGDMLLTLVTSGPRIRDEDAISRELYRRHPTLRGFYLFHNPHETEYVFRDGEHAGLDSRSSPLRKIHGGTLRERLGGCELDTSPLSFFQVNVGQAENVLRRIGRELGEAKRGRLIDAYAGVGALSLPLASRFGEVVALESVRHSCELARENAKRNGAARYRVMHGDAAGLLERACAERRSGGRGPERGDDAIIVDPPRAGLSPEAARAIARSGVPSVYYLSCEPLTQARDLERLTREGGYRVLRIAPFDMFPQTFHVECLVVLGKGRP
jgi:23S rRNA (uracil1939-C5)-methyltransferase